jgi:hypothetical protein
MKNYALLLGLLCCAITGKAQQTEQVTLDKKDAIIATADLGDSGIALLTGNPAGKKGFEYTLRYYNAAGKKKLEAKVPGHPKITPVLVASPSGRNFYVIDDDPVNSVKWITRVGESGQTNTNHLNTNYTQVRSYFANDSFLYEFRWRRDPPAKGEKDGKNVYWLMVINGQSLTQVTVNLNLPDMQGFYTLNQAKGEIYFATRQAKGSVLQSAVFIYNSHGTFTGKNVMNVDVSPNFPSCSNYASRITGCLMELNPNFNTGDGGLEENSEGGFTYDPAKNCYYAYGLTGTEGFNKLGAGHYPALDFYLAKYNAQGEMLWKSMNRLPKDIEGAKTIADPQLVTWRDVAFMIQPNGGYRMVVYVNKGEVFDMDDKGKVTKTFETPQLVPEEKRSGPYGVLPVDPNFGVLESLCSPDDQSPMATYIRTAGGMSDSRKFYAYPNSQSTLLVDYNLSKNTVNVLKF